LNAKPASADAWAAPDSVALISSGPAL